MGVKSMLVFSFLVAVISVPVAQTQLLGGLGGLVGQGGLLDPLFRLLFHITGTVFCTVNGNVGVNGTATRVFPNAVVQLQCEGNVVSTTTTNGLGLFSLVADPSSLALSKLLKYCKLVVPSPLSTCNADLPSIGGLESSLQLLSSILGILVPNGFQFNADVN